MKQLKHNFHIKNKKRQVRRMHKQTNKQVFHSIDNAKKQVLRRLEEDTRAADRRIDAECEEFLTELLWEANQSVNISLDDVRRL